MREYKWQKSYKPGDTFCRFVFKSDKIKSSLIKLGCVEKKSLVLKFPTTEQVPENLVRHFIRGYFDGDGSITTCHGKKWNIKICGTKELLEGILLNIVGQIKCIYKEKRNEKNNYYLSISGSKDVENILNQMYKNSSTYLERKYQRYLAFLEYNSRLSG